MNNLLFTALIIALIYYFLFYLPQQKKLNANANPPLKQNRATQTDESEIINFPGSQMVVETKELERLKKDIQQKEQTIIGLNNSYQKLETSKNKQLAELQSQIRELAKKPLKPTNSKSTQTGADFELTNQLDTLIKDIQDLNNSLD